ncbi:MAG: hypothetical protein JWN30_2570, partial [Bacilli bacterium]|nr:hypothetical protein [Bacilli bacterium]
HFLCLQFEESHAGEESSLDGAEAFLTELGSLHEGMMFARYLPDGQADILTGDGATLIWTVFLPQSKPNQEDELLRELKSWVDLVSSELFLQLRIGISRNCDGAPSGYACLQDSLFALLQGFRFRPEDRVYHYNDLGIIHLLAGISQTAKDRFLDHLHAMDRRAELAPELKETAWAFMKNDLNITETARSLYLHRNSLMYRLDRILEITGLDLRRFEDAVLMWLCLHLLH